MIAWLIGCVPAATGPYGGGGSEENVKEGKKDHTKPQINNTATRPIHASVHEVRLRAR